MSNSSYFPTVASLTAKGVKASYFIEKQFKKGHTILDGAPCEWSEKQGATHTLSREYASEWSRKVEGFTRPVKLLKTVLYIGLGEEDENGNIVWEKWNGKIVNRFTF